MWHLVFSSFCTLSYGLNCQTLCEKRSQGLEHFRLRDDVRAQLTLTKKSLNELGTIFGISLPLVLGFPFLWFRKPIEEDLSDPQKAVSFFDENLSKLLEREATQEAPHLVALENLLHRLVPSHLVLQTLIRFLPSWALVFQSGQAKSKTTEPELSPEAQKLLQAWEAIRSSLPLSLQKPERKGWEAFWYFVDQPLFRKKWEETTWVLLWMDGLLLPFWTLLQWRKSKLERFLNAMEEHPSLAWEQFCLSCSNGP